MPLIGCKLRMNNTRQTDCFHEIIVGLYTPYFEIVYVVPVLKKEADTQK